MLNVPPDRQLVAERIPSQILSLREKWLREALGSLLGHNRVATILHYCAIGLCLGGQQPGIHELPEQRPIVEPSLQSGEHLSRPLLVLPHHRNQPLGDWFEG